MPEHLLAGGRRSGLVRQREAGGHRALHRGHASFSPRSTRWRRNPHYWQAGEPALRALRFRAYAANEQAILALLHGELDWAGSFIPAIRRVYQARDPEHHHYWFPLLDSTVFLYANTRRPPLDDVRVRKALSMAIDRTRIAAIAMHGYTRPADATGLVRRLRPLPRPRRGRRPGTGSTHDPAARRTAARRGRAAPRVPTGAGAPAAARVICADPAGAGRVLRLDRRRPDRRPRACAASAWRSSFAPARRTPGSSKLQTGDFDLSMAWSDLVTTPYGFYRSLMSTATVQPLGEDARRRTGTASGCPRPTRCSRRSRRRSTRQEERRLVDELQRLFVEHAPAIPLFPGTLWGEFNTRRATGFPDENAPYAPLAPYIDGPQTLLVLHPACAPMKFLLRRLGFYLVAAWASLTLAFFLPRLIPGDPARVLLARFRGRLPSRGARGPARRLRPAAMAASGSSTSTTWGTWPAASWASPSATFPPRSAR